MKHFLILIIAIVYFNPVVGQTPVVEWKKNISTGHPKIIIQTNENGFASLTHFDNVITLTKSDENGDLLWDYKFENAFPNQISNFIETKNGDFLLVGSQSNPSTSTDLWLIKLDKNGNYLWQKSFGGKVLDSGVDIIESSDNNILVVGFTSSLDGDVSNNNGYIDVWVVKVDFDGNVIWKRTYGGTGEEVPFLIKKSKEGYWIQGKTSGSTDGNLNNSYNRKGSWNFHINEQGEITKQIVLDFVSSVFMEEDNGYLSVFYNEIEKQYSVVKFDLNGKYIWDKKLDLKGEYYSLNNIIQLNTKEFIFYGSNLTSELTRDREVFLMKYDSNFNKIWEINLGTELIDYSVSKGLKILSDDEYLVFGSTQILNTEESTEMIPLNLSNWVTKVSEPNLATTEFSNSNSVDFSPNPVKDVLNITNNENISRIYIFNYLGQLVYDSYLNSETTSINTTNLCSGNYILKLETINNTKTIKFIKQ